MKHYMPVRVFTGEHAIEENAAVLTSAGSRCMLVTGRCSAVKSGALADVGDVLNRSGIPFCVFDAVEQNPSVASCLAAGSRARDFAADYIIGIGGGSALDAAKAAAVFAANPGLNEKSFYEKAWQKDPLPFFLVGTTAGTGSEVTRVSVLTDGRKRKHSIHDDRLFAAAAFGDPRYTLSLPRPVTLSTGIDVISHCTESYFSRKADEISRAFAVRGIQLLYAPLLASAEGKELTLRQREELYEASILGGLAICGTGTCFPHTLGYLLTENFGIAHGFASACFLPDLLFLVREKMSGYADRFFRELEIPEADFLHLVRLSVPDPGIFLPEEEISDVLPRWENNNSVQNTCCELGTAEIRKILEQHFLKK